MRENVPCEFPAGYDSTAILERLGQVLDPELDELILDLGFVRSLELRSGHASLALRLPTSWCAVNFAYLMAEDVRRALLAVEGHPPGDRAVLATTAPQQRSRPPSTMGDRLRKPFPARAPEAWRCSAAPFSARGFSAARSVCCESCVRPAARLR